MSFDMCEILKTLQYRKIRHLHRRATWQQGNTKMAGPYKLVRIQYGKRERAIRVYWFPILNAPHHLSPEVLNYAALLACKRGWKNIILRAQAEELAFYDEYSQYYDDVGYCNLASINDEYNYGVSMRPFPTIDRSGKFLVTRENIHLGFEFESDDELPYFVSTVASMKAAIYS